MAIPDESAHCTPRTPCLLVSQRPNDYPGYKGFWKMKFCFVIVVRQPK